MDDPAVLKPLSSFARQLAPWRHVLPRSPVPAGASDRGYTFYLHRSANDTSILLAVVLVGAIEIPLLHLLVASWSRTVAWILTGITIASVVWVIGFVRAGGYRHSRVVGDELHLVYGLYEELTVRRGELSAWKFVVNGSAVAAGGNAADTHSLSPKVRRYSISFHEPISLTRFSGRTEAVEAYEFDVSNQEAIEWLEAWLPAKS